MPELLPHQLEGVEFLTSRSGALLAYEQGLGKTAIALTAFQQLKTAGQIAKMLVICPNSLKNNWIDEIAKFLGSATCTVVEGTGQGKRRALHRSSSEIIIINYEAARSEITSLRALLAKESFVLILDESHNVKNLKSLNALVAHNLAPYARFKWLLSGTPVTNKPIDIYSQIEIVAQNNPLGSPELFELKYGIGDHAAQTDLAEIVRPYLIRKTKADCLKLPSKIFKDVRVDLPGWQREMYDVFRDRFVEEVRRLNERDFSKFVPTALTRLTRLSQIASNPSLVDPTEKRTPAKMVSIDELLESDGMRDEKVIIWSNYVKTIESLVNRYREKGARAIYGGVKTDERQEIARLFQTGNSVRLLVANPAAAGTGFTFTAARYSIFESLSWRYDHFAQSQDRNHRIGQDRDVVYIRLLARDTIEDTITEALAEKESMAKGILGDVRIPAYISAMTQEEFIGLLINKAF